MIAHRMLCAYCNPDEIKSVKFHRYLTDIGLSLVKSLNISNSEDLDIEEISMIFSQR